MGPAFFDEVVDRSGTDSLKWTVEPQRWAPHPVDFPMGVADMDFRIAPAITDLIQKRVALENWGYGYTTDRLKEVICSWLHTRYAEDVTPAQIDVTPGLIPSMRSAIQTFAQPGDKVLMQSPVYHGFYMITAKAHCVAEPVQLKRSPDGTYAMDFDALDRQMDDQVKVMLLCNPHNPTGNCWTEQDLLAVGRLCLERGVALIVDEVHSDFINPGASFTPFLNLPEAAVVENAIIFKAASKTFNLAGLHCAYHYSRNADYMERLIDAGLNRLVNDMGLLATEAAYTVGLPWLDGLLPYLDANLDLAADFVRAELPGVSMAKPEATFFAWLDMAELSDQIDVAGLAAGITGPFTQPNHALQRWIQEHARIYMTSGIDHGPGGDGFMRMNLATSKDRVARALDSLKHAIDAVPT